MDGSRISAYSRVVSMLGLAVIAAAVAVETLTVRVPTAVSLNYGEGFAQFDALLAARGQPLYADPSTRPWTVHVYTPLYTLLLSGFLRLGADGYAAGRLISYASVLATALLVALTGRPRTGRAAWGVAALYLSLPIFVSWGAIVRPDDLAVALAALGVVVVERWAGRRACCWAVPLFLAAGLTKQSTLAAPAASLLYLALRDPRMALRFAALLAGGTLAFVAALQFASGGWFWFHAVTSHLAKPFGWERVWAVMRAFLEFHAPVALAGAALLAWTAWRRRLSIYALWLGLSLAWTPSAGKLGSDVNYFLEPLAALAFLAAHELPTALVAHRSAWMRAAAGLAVPVLAVALAAFHLWLHYANDTWIEQANHRRAQLLRELSGVEGAMVSDDAGILLGLGRPLVFRPFIMSQLARAGVWDERPFLEALRRREIQRVIFKSKPAEVRRIRYTPRMRAALARNYERVGGFTLRYEYAILAPRPREGAQPATSRPPAAP